MPESREEKTGFDEAPARSRVQADSRPTLELQEKGTLVHALLPLGFWKTGEKARCHRFRIDCRSDCQMRLFCCEPCEVSLAERAEVQVEAQRDATPEAQRCWSG